MPEQDITPANDAAAVDYAFWEERAGGFKVLYSLPLFHEIDFLVNEGYRKIPHGGIETGGILFGAIEKDSVKLEAFCEIECEHASGPSFQLSERDLAALETRIKSAKTDPELSKYRPVGWFLAHTRSSLIMTDREAALFDEFFKDAFQVTVLVKPERFQPTRFGFLVRDAKKEVPRDATQTAIILPLPGRATKSDAPIPSIPAPKQTEAPKRLRADRKLEETEPAAATEEQAASPPPSKTTPGNTASSEITPSDLKTGKITPPVAAPEPAPAPIDIRTAAEKEARKQMARNRSHAIEQAFRAEAPAAREAPAENQTALSVLPHRSALISAGLAPYPVSPGAMQLAAPPPETESIFNSTSIAALAIAALLGCLAGYFAYLQLPAPIILLDVRPVQGNMVVSWPPEETRNAIYAAIRFNDGTPVPLSPDEKTMGQVLLTTQKDFKVELVARNWLRDSRGIVRYLRASHANPPGSNSSLP